MNLNELHGAVREALAQAPDSTRLNRLALEAGSMADMTGWANGPIDPQGRIAAAFDALKLQARLRFEETNNPDIAQLYDALADLMSAISRHDDDLRPDGIGASEDDD